MQLCLAVFITHGAQKHTKAYFKVAAWDETGMTSTHTEIPRFLKRGLGRKKKTLLIPTASQAKEDIGMESPNAGMIHPTSQGLLHPCTYYNSTP